MWKRIKNILIGWIRKQQAERNITTNSKAL
jgi:hypothetical protein